MPMVANQPNNVLPAVHANGRPSGPSRLPGAWPTSITGDTTAPPLTTGPIMSGQAVHPRRRVTWRFSWTSTDTAPLWRTRLTLHQRERASRPTLDFPRLFGEPWRRARSLTTAREIRERRAPLALCCAT
jgi:hypothetical protein